MGSTYLELTNKVLVPFNEVPLTTGNFASAMGFHLDVKNAINTAISDIYLEEDGEWPFAFTKITTAVGVGQSEYSISAGLSVIDWDSFLLIKTGTPTECYMLPLFDFDTYRKYYLTQDTVSEIDGTNLARPLRVIRGQDNSFILSPVPDFAYNVRYNGFAAVVELTNYSDTSVIPEEYESIIIDKALHYAYMFRDNKEQADLAQARYMDGLSKMRRKLIPQSDTLRQDS